MTMKDVERQAVALGAVFEFLRDSGRGPSVRAIEHEIRCEAPGGKIWSADHSHELICRNDNIQALINDVSERMALGLEQCTAHECEWCYGFVE